MLPIETRDFDTRLARTRFVAERFARYLAGKVLDVGCFEAPLRGMLPAGNYTGVDIAGHPDIRLDLDAAERLPFDDGGFPTVLCIEVLEHLDNLHRIFGELVRVSGRHVIVSLPNCWRDARRAIERGRGDFAHYGLPAEKPVDRHKWFFGFTQARAFMTAMAEKHGLEIVELFATEKDRSPLTRGLRRMIYPGDAYYNRYAQTIWAVFAKRDGATATAEDGGGQRA